MSSNCAVCESNSKLLVNYIMHSNSIIDQIKEFQCSAALIAGSGIGKMLDKYPVLFECSFSEIGFEIEDSSVIGHNYKCRVISICSNKVLLFLGRLHSYEGYSFCKLTFVINFIHSLKIDSLIVTNAAGGLHPKFSVGDIMICNEIVCTTQRLFKIHHHSNHSGSMQWLKATLNALTNSSTPFHVGTYVYVPGPSYETRAEIRYFRMLADAIGMSSFFEVNECNRLGIKWLCCSVITNTLSDTSKQLVDHKEVLDVSLKSEQSMLFFFECAISSI